MGVSARNVLDHDIVSYDDEDEPLQRRSAGFSVSMPPFPLLCVATHLATRSPVHQSWVRAGESVSERAIKSDFLEKIRADPILVSSATLHPTPGSEQLPTSNVVRRNTSTQHREILHLTRTPSLLYHGQPHHPCRTHRCLCTTGRPRSACVCVSVVIRSIVVFKGQREDEAQPEKGEAQDRSCLLWCHRDHLDQ